MSVSLDRIVDISVQVSEAATISSDFTLGLIIGSTVNQATGADKRVKIYSAQDYVSAMVADGYEVESNEFKAAQAYFSQDPCPSSVAIGFMADGETMEAALTACRAYNQDFYAVIFVHGAPNQSDMLAAAKAIEGLKLKAVGFFQTDSDTCLNTGSSNPMKLFQDNTIKRSSMTYTKEDFTFSARLMGLFCGMNSLGPNSAYTMAYKTLAGAKADGLSDTQMTAIEGYGGNAYTNFGRRYNLFYPGVMPDGTHMDELFFVDIVEYLIQQYTVAGLIPLRKVPQTDDGLAQILSFISSACEELVTIGFVGPGTWTGQNVLDLAPGDALPGGYLVQAEDLATQSAQDRANRKTPPIYVALKGSGAFEHVVISVIVNQ